MLALLQSCFCLRCERVDVKLSVRIKGAAVRVCDVARRCRGSGHERLPSERNRSTRYGDPAATLRRQSAFSFESQTM
ncbi:hypothetical protein PHSY_006444 [Pseudozyma hubeiensis SY62]|uniref:Uncharacterized protein n=1 Tax=Pseudozyma hubeiensis (strain SY62) TaxID=1305764 RepID=R9PBZ4_PSEHS|nr:hypothetical protein PHSY_006444 [Pseudozyma hubeiensis SY62]GAC98849.1 hypothetical protein PHSY_006444 [Pseudozyma hubeiensis SY62]